jgi:hypothetical protein
MEHMSITDADLGIVDGQHSKTLTHVERSCVSILEAEGMGQDSAVPADTLAMKLFLDCTETEKRSVRHLVNHLIISHRIPVMSAAGKGGGYFLPLTKGEEEAVYRNRRKRAMTALLKMSRGRKASYVETIEQLSFWFDEPEGARALERLKLAPDRDPVPVWLKLVTRSLDKLAKDPQKYASELEQLRGRFGAILMPRAILDELKRQAEDQVDLLRRLAS